ncbi:MAG TPA: hypothetical protein VG871_13275 [Vicinamibacterales bacterium]|nr:hypothetical protein [Vicinamibacterales bacterium]
MAKLAISVTIDRANLTWLKARVGADGARSVSDLVDRLITEARTSGSTGGIRSVVGTIDLDPADPLLDEADAAVAGLFEQSLRRPVLARERPARNTSGPSRKTRARG